MSDTMVCRRCGAEVAPGLICPKCEAQRRRRFFRTFYTVLLAIILFAAALVGSMLWDDML